MQKVMHVNGKIPEKSIQKSWQISMAAAKLHGIYMYSLNGQNVQTNTTFSL